MRTILFALFLIAVSLAPSFSHAGDVVACGVPKDVNISLETENYCDIHQRRLAYREKAIQLKEQMRERAEIFAAPRREALKQYEQDMQALNESRTSIEPSEDEEADELAMEDALEGETTEDESE